MKDFATWTTVHALHWAILYLAFGANVEGAMYVLKFWVWVMAPLSLALLADRSVQASAKKPPQPVLGWLSWLQAWATLGLLVWFGHIASGLAWGFVMVMSAWHRDVTKKARAAMAQGDGSAASAA
jgi:hypothetical protein